jgi:beta-glucosidase
MKKIILCLLGAMTFSSAIAKNVPQLGKSSVDEVLKAMTLEEKARILVGTGMDGFSGDNAVVGETHSIVPGAAGTTYPIPRLGIPAIVLADGPAGLRISPKRENNSETYYCTAFPVATVLASTWNTELVEEVGKAMGNEVLEYGVDVLLAPALNIHRNPLCGRNFEYYSEDPLVAGKITAAMVRGVQSNGVGTSIKHFAANNQETNRQSNDARVTPRALREIYLKGFEIAVKESAPQTVMSSYNYINGTYSSESRDLLTTILRNEWGFKGVVMTDWFAGKNPAAQMHAGNDLLMPGSDKQYRDIVAAVKNGSLSIEDVDTNVRRVLNLIVESPRLKKYHYSDKPDLKAHAEVTRQSAAEGMILLKNEAALPFPAKVKTVAAYGITSYDFIAGGTGSGDVNKAYTVSLVEGLNNAGYQLDADLQVLYEKYIQGENEKNKPDPNNPLAAFMPKIRPGEFADRKIPDDFDLSKNEMTLIRDVCSAFHAVKKKVIVILNIGGVIETASWKELPDAILLAGQAGQEGGNTVADALSGKINPSGKLTATYPVKYEDAASSSNFPFDYKANNQFIMGGASKEKKDFVRNVDYTNYEEGIYVGYRYFDTFGKEVSYPFGYGLSYTSFSYSNPKIKEADGVYTLTVEVKNVGKVAGKEVVQLYVSAPANERQPKPAKELKAFAKTKELKPVEKQTITMTVKVSDLASFDEKTSAWVTDSGRYQFLIGASSQDIKASLDILISQKTEIKTNDVLKLQEKINILIK